MPVQAAEHALRIEHALEGVDEVALEGVRRSPGEVVVTFGVPSGRFVVRVGIELADPVVLTCRSSAEEPPPSYRVLGIDPVTPP